MLHYAHNIIEKCNQSLFVHLNVDERETRSSAVTERPRDAQSHLHR